MGQSPEDFNQLLGRELAARQQAAQEAARLAAEQFAAERVQAQAAQQQEAQRLAERRELGALLAQDALRVAQAAQGRVPQDAWVGRLLVRPVGWVLSIRSQSYDNGQDGRNFRSWNLVHATTLSPAGRIQIARPAQIKDRDIPVRGEADYKRILHRSWGVDDIEDPSRYDFDIYRRQLVDFVLNHGLQQ